MKQISFESREKNLTFVLSATSALAVGPRLTCLVVLCVVTAHLPLLFDGNINFLP